MAQHGASNGGKHHYANGGHYHGTAKPSCGICCKFHHGHNEGCSKGVQVEEMWGDTADIEGHPSHGPFRRHAGAGNVVGQDGGRSMTKFEVDFLDRLQDLELQMRMVCGDNIELKKVISRMYNFATASQIEIRDQYARIAAKIDNLEESLGLAHPCKAQKPKATDNELADINRKMDKLKKFMATTRNYVDLSTDGNKAAEAADAAMGDGPYQL